MKSIITISREFGSGGRTIGRLAAEKLGYAFYDKELIEKVAGETHLSPEFIKESGEYAPSTNLFSYAFVGRSMNGHSTEDYLWSAQQKIILELAGKGRCVIVGRCADYILENREDCFNVFIHSDIENRVKRIIEKYGENGIHPEKRIKDKDKKRKINYEYYTDRVWGMSQNYHLALDSGVLGIQTCVDLIINAGKNV